MTTPQQSPSSHERRKHPRVALDTRFESQLEPAAQDVIIRDMSLGGFLIESASAFKVNAVHHFRIAEKNGHWTTVLTAKSVHCRPRSENGEVSYLTGFAFLDPQGMDATERVHELINRATSVVRF